MVHNPALGVHDAEGQVVATAVLNVNKAVQVGGHLRGFKGSKVGFFVVVSTMLQNSPGILISHL